MPRATILPEPLRTAGLRKSSVSRWRAAVLIGVNLLMLAHLLHWRLTGRTVSPIEPSEAMETLQRGAINAGFIFFALALLATLVFGRFVCGWGCHILALQDGCAWLLKKGGLTPKPFRSRLLIYVPLLAALYMFVWPTAYRLFLKPQEPLIPKLTNHLITTDFWATFPSLPVAIPFLFICGFLTVYFLGQKGFCTYACPYGGFFAIADKLSPFRIRVTDACTQCGHCTATCTSNVLVHAEVKQYQAVVDPGCMKCMDCISVCPTNALYLGFGKPSVAIKKSKPRTYSLTWPEELLGAGLFAASFFAVRGVYGMIPFLMALGWASVTTFLGLKSWRLLKAETVTFHHFVLKTAGVMRPAAWSFLLVSALGLGLTTHSGWIRYHEARGSKAFDLLQIADELALAQLNPARWLTPLEHENIANGRRHLRIAAGYGLFANGELLAKLAWFHYLDGDATLAAGLLTQAADQQRGHARALSLHYRGAILNRLGCYEEALASLEQALVERSDLILALEEKGETLWLLGQREAAVATWQKALKQNPNLPLACNQLAGALQAMGNKEDAKTLQQETDSITPDIAAYHWMLAVRLQRLGMAELAETHFQSARQLDPHLSQPD